MYTGICRFIICCATCRISGNNSDFPSTSAFIQLVMCSDVLKMKHYSDFIMSAMASRITGVSIVFSVVCSGTDQRKYQGSASLVDSPHKGPVTQRMFSFDGVIMINVYWNWILPWRATEYPVTSRLIPCLLMPRFLVSPGHQQPWNVYLSHIGPCICRRCILIMRIQCAGFIQNAKLCW